MSASRGSPAPNVRCAARLAPALAAAVFLLPDASDAAVHRCVDSYGRVAYQAFACQQDAPAAAPQPRSSTRWAFQKIHPCPLTGSRDAACPGYVADYIKPLPCGGADAPENMQWLTDEEGKAKQAREAAACGDGAAH